MNTKSQYGFEQIKISDRLDEVINKAIERAKKEKLELLRNKLERLLEVTENLVDSEVVSLSQELDKLILNYYFLEEVGSISVASGKVNY